MAAFWILRTNDSTKLIDAERFPKPSIDAELVDFGVIEFRGTKRFEYSSASEKTVALQLMKKHPFMGETDDIPSITPFDQPDQDFCPYDDD